MTVTAFTGAAGTFPSPDGQNPQAGPVFGQHGSMLLDIRSPFTYQPGGIRPFYGFGATRCIAIDQVPSTIADNNIAASQTPGAGVHTITLVSSSGAGITVGQTITNATTGAVVTGLLAIDTKSGAVTYGSDGTVNVWDPGTLIARAVRITSGDDDTGITFTVNGYDIYGYPMTETITGADTGVAAGKKAFKYIASITSSGDIAGTVKVGTSDVYGFPLRVDRFAYANIAWNDGVITASTGFVAADTATANATTGDVRGTYAVQSASDGTKRLQIFITINPTNIKTSTGTYGVAQF